MEPEKKSNGAFIGLIIIVIILVIGGIYVWISNQSTLAPVKNSQSQAETKITSQDAAALDALEQDSTTIDTSTGVDASKVY